MHICFRIMLFQIVIKQHCIDCIPSILFQNYVILDSNKTGADIWRCSCLFQNYVILDSNKTLNVSHKYCAKFQNYVILDSNKTYQQCYMKERSFQNYVILDSNKTVFCRDFGFGSFRIMLFQIVIKLDIIKSEINIVLFTFIVYILSLRIFNFYHF